jgi:hypothetical protein
MFGLVLWAASLVWFGSWLASLVWFCGQQCWFDLVKYAGSDESYRTGFYAWLGLVIIMFDLVWLQQVLLRLAGSKLGLVLWEAKLASLVGSNVGLVWWAASLVWFGCSKFDVV